MAERRYENKAITFSLKENKENQRELFKFMALKWTRRTTDKLKSRDRQMNYKPTLQIPAFLSENKNTCSSKFVASSVQVHKYSHHQPSPYSICMYGLFCVRFYRYDVLL